MKAYTTNYRYPFRVKATRKGVTRVKIILANSYKNALNKILELYPAKFVLTKYARNMDLITAKVEAAKESKTQKCKVFVYAEPDGEVEYSINPVKPKQTLLHIFERGSEIKIVEDAGTIEATPVVTKVKAVKDTPLTIKSSSTKKEKSMTTKTKKKVATKTTKKVTAKKLSPVKKSSEEKTKLGASSFFNKEDMKKLNGILTKNEMSFNAWVNSLIRKVI